MINGVANCVCRKVESCPRDVNIVCGSDGNSYLNPCRMKIEACKRKKDITRSHDGVCGELMGLSKGYVYTLRFVGPISYLNAC